ncbi:MAG: hypothetical protein ACKVQA_11840 [Burkholderiales bacterium]
MSESFTKLKTDQGLLDALKEASSRKLSHDELEEQRVSFIASAVHRDVTVTHERIRQILAQQAGE